jgi:hypothetical protein
MPLWAARAFSIVNSHVRSLRAARGRDFDATSAKAARPLGWKPRPIDDTIVKSAESLLAGHILTRRDQCRFSAIDVAPVRCGRPIHLLQAALEHASAQASR